MKAEPVVFTNGGISIELVGETAFEVSLLQKAFQSGQLKRGAGSSLTENGSSTGFYIDVPITPKETA